MKRRQQAGYGMTRLLNYFSPQDQTLLIVVFLRVISLRSSHLCTKTSAAFGLQPERLGPIYIRYASSL